MVFNLDTGILEWGILVAKHQDSLISKASAPGEEISL